MPDKTFITIKPPLKAVDNGDGTYSVSIKDVNSADLLAAVEALGLTGTLTTEQLLMSILLELKKIETHLSIVTDEKITEEDTNVD